MIPILYALNCEPIKIDSTVTAYEVSKPGQYEYTLANPLNYVYAAAKTCRDSRKLQFTIFRGTRYGVAQIRAGTKVTIKVYEQGLFLSTPEPQTLPVYILIKERGH